MIIIQGDRAIMSRYKYPEDDPNAPDVVYEDPEFLNEIDQGYIGLELAQIEKTIISPREEYYMHMRAKASNDLGIPIEEIMDEPDNDPADPRENWG